MKKSFRYYSMIIHKKHSIKRRIYNLWLF